MKNTEDDQLVLSLLIELSTSPFRRPLPDVIASRRVRSGRIAFQRCSNSIAELFEEVQLMYRPVQRAELADTLVRLRDIYRKKVYRSDSERLAHERREIVVKNLLSNLTRMKEHPTLNTVLEVADIFSLSLDSAHRMFGYDLEEMRSYDLQWNSGRTHIVDCCPFTDHSSLELNHNGNSEALLREMRTLRTLVQAWWSGTESSHSQQKSSLPAPNSFYVRVGTEDSLASSLPAGSLALVEPVDIAERSRPVPSVMYLLQFGNGYRCSRCVVMKDKLLLLAAPSNYQGIQSFPYPGTVRIAGKIRMFAVSLPAGERADLHALNRRQEGAPLVLPWEHPTINRLFAAKHSRFRRPPQERKQMADALGDVFQRKLSGRTERRYRWMTQSQPHVDTLMQITLLNRARYSDVLRSLRPKVREHDRFSLSELLQADLVEDLHEAKRKSNNVTFREPFFLPTSTSRYLLPPIRHEVIAKLSSAITDVELPIPRGALLRLERIIGELASDALNADSGRSKALYAALEGDDLLYGTLARDRAGYVLTSKNSLDGGTKAKQISNLDDLWRVTGMAVAV